jgi:carboxymethylenebutenolidase
MRPGITSIAAITAAALLASACTVHRMDSAAADEHAGHDMTTGSAAGTLAPQRADLPASANTVAARLLASPRHAEWQVIRTGPTDSVRAYVVYPERRDNAPVVVVIHEIFGLSAWVRGVADQLAADGFIAIAPDLLTGRAPLDGDSLQHAVARSTIANLSSADAQRMIGAVGAWGMQLPAAAKKYGVVGYCWGGTASFNHAVTAAPGLSAAVVYYGTFTDLAGVPRITAPVLGLYGGNDQRVNATIPAADSAMKAQGRSFEHHIFDGAGHGFLRQQETPEANMRATERAWPMTIQFFRKHLGA